MLVCWRYLLEQMKERTNRKWLNALTQLYFRHALYSGGDRLGFLMYTYKQNLTSGLLLGSECSTDYLGSNTRFIPVMQIRLHVRVEPPFTVTGQRVQFSVRLEGACQIETTYWIRSVKVYNSYYKQVGTEYKDIYLYTCQTPRIYFPFILTTPKTDDILRFVIQGSFEVHHRFVVLSNRNEILVQPKDAINDQLVTITCFKEFMTLLAQKTDGEKNKFTISQIHSLELVGVRQNIKHVLVSLDAHKKLTVNRRRIINFKLRNGTKPATWLELQTTANNLAPYNDFQCRLQMNHSLVPVYSLYNRERVCFLQMLHRIRVGINKLLLPSPSKRVTRNAEHIQVHQVSCIKPASSLEVLCSQYQRMSSCGNTPRISQIFETNLEILIRNHFSGDIQSYSPIATRPGQHSITLRDISENMHLSTIICRQQVYTKESTSSSVFTHYSVAAMLCVSALEFKFYNIRDGFDKETGLKYTQEQILLSENMVEIFPEVVIELVESSGIVCSTESQEKLINTKLIFYAGSFDIFIKTFDENRRSFAIIPQIENDSHNTRHIAIGYCQTIRADENVTSISKVSSLLQTLS